MVGAGNGLPLVAAGDAPAPGRRPSGRAEIEHIVDQAAAPTAAARGPAP
jgi:hypothetical protein